MKKSYIVPLVIMFIILPALIILTNNSQNPEEVCIEDKKCFSIEIAETDEERRIGLSQHEFLEEDSGMLFVFPEENRPGFWMKDMNFSIDIMWINSNLEIVGIEKDLQPCSEENCPVVFPDQKIKYVLEINAKSSDVHGFQEGDLVQIK